MSSIGILPRICSARLPSLITPVRLLCPQAAFDVVALVASVGGFLALREILAALPTDFPAALLFQMHLDPRHPSLLVELLRPRTALPVEWAAQGQALRPGTVTVVPPGQHVRVCPGGVVTLTSWADRSYTRPRCDELLSAVGASFRTRALGVVLTGSLDDGARGAQALHHYGGRVPVQDPATAKAAGMPAAAVRTGCADVVVPLPAIPGALWAWVTGGDVAPFPTVPSVPQSHPERDA